MYLALGRLPFPYEDTRTWVALRDALRELERFGAIKVECGERPILSVLCTALDRAGVFSLGEVSRTPAGR
jgi:hypothetical protein